MPPNIVSEVELFNSQFQPNLKNRFLAYIDGIPSYMVKMVSRGKSTTPRKEIPHINLMRYTKGRTVWSEQTVKLYDPITPSGQQTVFEWLRLMHESLTGRDGYDDMYKKDIIMHQLGPVGDVISESIWKGCFMTDTDLGENDWASDDLTEITLQLSVDYIILNY